MSRTPQKTAVSPCWLPNRIPSHYSRAFRSRALFDEIFTIAQQWYKEQLGEIWGRSGSPCWLSRQYRVGGGVRWDKLPCVWAVRALCPLFSLNLHSVVGNIAGWPSNAVLSNITRCPRDIGNLDGQLPADCQVETDILAHIARALVLESERRRVYV